MAKPSQVMRREVAGDGRLFFPEAPFPHGIQLIFKKYDYKNLIVNRNTNFRSAAKAAEEKDIVAIELPMPTSLQDATGLIINGFERTFVESFVSDTLAPVFSGDGGGFGDAVNKLFGVGEGAVKGGYEAITKMIADPQSAGGAMGNALGQSSRVLSFFMRNTLNNMGLGKSINAATGAAVNPQATLSFEGVNLRTFQLDWTLYPESETEAQQIKKIVRTIKRNILPKTQSLTGDLKLAEDQAGGITNTSLARAFLEYPAVVFINLLGVDESAFVRFKPCMADNITVDYGGSGSVVVAQGGVPQGVKITMSFKELEIQTAEDFMGDE